MTYALIFANGDIADGPMVRRALTILPTPIVIAADAGARIARQFNLHVDIIIGDMDSLSPEELDEFAQAGSELRQYPPQKDFTDLELALRYACHALNVKKIYIVGSTGGRIDQMLANIHMLALPVLDGCAVHIVAGNQEVCILRPGKHTITGDSGDTISLMAVGGDAQSVTTQNLAYPLTGETLPFGSSRGVSNVMQAGSASISIQAGLLLVIHTLGHA